MTEWYVRVIDTGQIVNCITTASGVKPDISYYENADDLFLDNRPPMSVLEQYRYWNERP